MSTPSEVLALTVSYVLDTTSTRARRLSDLLEHEREL